MTAASSSSSSSYRHPPNKNRKRHNRHKHYSTNQNDITQHDNSNSNNNNNDNNNKFHIFCDMDGVLCDFDLGVRRLNREGRSANDMPTKTMWYLINHKAYRFYENLDWTPDGRELWQHIQPLHPDILTGVAQHHSCRNEKFVWCQRELLHSRRFQYPLTLNHVDMAAEKRSHHLVSGDYIKQDGVTNVITCWSKNKHYESGHNCVLIDDRISLKADWVAKGGIFVHHTTTKNTLRQLRKLGILNSHNNNNNNNDNKAHTATATAAKRLRATATVTTPTTTPFHFSNQQLQILQVVHKHENRTLSNVP
eukprot:CAMPEP_0202445446 /NCGR_PEP_ID=MMETSP1360-20130828/4272_1 /ASSEMBLY_ACC=CAM_ASM_000848 /TAXON_ID=515479 /ORGANISM="Licmophora paradoxa, Strain CCMP2313" /LENGTH=306 /DNA_ID=CAMNT_0049061723 /DNA_START=157 /DNA_END=1077 /DNA_ORIENTATION=-